MEASSAADDVVAALRAEAVEDDKVIDLAISLARGVINVADAATMVATCRTHVEEEAEAAGEEHLQPVERKKWRVRAGKMVQAARVRSVLSDLGIRVDDATRRGNARPGKGAKHSTTNRDCDASKGRPRPGKSAKHSTPNRDDASKGSSWPGKSANDSTTNRDDANKGSSWPGKSATHSTTNRDDDASKGGTWPGTGAKPSTSNRDG